MQLLTKNLLNKIIYIIFFSSIFVLYMFCYLRNWLMLYVEKVKKKINIYIIFLMIIKTLKKLKPHKIQFMLIKKHFFLVV